jgi:hypothetical protein
MKAGVIRGLATKTLKRNITLKGRRRLNVNKKVAVETALA